MLFDGISPFSGICLRKVIFQKMVQNGSLLVKRLHCWGKKIQLCTALSKLFSIAFTICIVYHIYCGDIINKGSKLTFLIHTLANIAWWRPSWKVANIVGKCNMPLIFVKLSPVVFTRSAWCHIPNISALRNWKWTLSLAFGAHYCGMAAILENGCHGLKI